MKIGFVGLGLMGRPMVNRLISAGHAITAYDVSPAAFDGWTAPPRKATSLREMSSCEIVILMLPNGSIVDDVLFYSGKLASALPEGSLVLDMGSSDPEGSRARASELAGCGIRFVDAPVSGGVNGATEGTLTIMVGGSDALHDGERGILEVLGKTIFEVGPVGSGHAVKALNNALSASSLLAMAEATESATRFGIEPAVFVDIINKSSGRSFSSEWKYPQFVLPGTFNSGFSLSLMTKDVATAVNLCEQLGLPALALRTAGEAWKKASGSLESSADHTEIVRWVARR
ncbi:NAD(P)-dependent oxidoreductase [Leucobacter chromiireducens]|uniref:NAD(P)-dependent oxidoreductase n=1 Tax=Leucobacter chromiireducens subsp. solipictus TaxID=398235 RepID=A0ABS1SHE1_9MICO|nr:NAD(P)-dependent oxidoreductase [Leucobacter chromiireducens]MBL3678884.1 NAD(P)-dependent oxidoreductase [Leucobacter chromiireducens subsp. solipictus]